jgi:hypothetical protein
MKKKEISQQHDFVSSDVGKGPEGETNVLTGPDIAMREVIQQAFDLLEEQGLMRKTGELVRGRAEDLQPVYTPTIVADWLDETGLIDDFNQYLATLEDIKSIASSHPELRGRRPS